MEYDNVQKLIEWCDKQIERDFSNLDILDETRYKRINACICMKLMILTGITYREARKLEIDNLNVMESTVNINSYIIRLPKKLSCQFNKYYKIREKYNLIKNRYLFNTFNGDQWGDKTSASGIPSFLKTAILKTTILSISKYGIIQLIKCGINDSVIMNLTGASREIMNDCIYLVLNKIPIPKLFRSLNIIDKGV